MYYRETPPPTSHMIVKHFGCKAIHNKALYKCIIHSLECYRFTYCMLFIILNEVMLSSAPYLVFQNLGHRCCGRHFHQFLLTMIVPLYRLDSWDSLYSSSCVAAKKGSMFSQLFHWSSLFKTKLHSTAWIELNSKHRSLSTSKYLHVPLLHASTAIL